MKSQLFGFLFTFLAGPIGLLYSSASAALSVFLIAVVFGLPSGGAGAIIGWPLAIIVSFFTVRARNKKLSLEERRHQEIVSAIRHGETV